MMPWLVTHASQDRRTALFRSIPSLRLFYWLTLRYYPPVRPGARPRRLAAWGRARPASVYEAVIDRFPVELESAPWLMRARRGGPTGRPG